MGRATSLGTAVATLCASSALHAAVLLAPAGHSAASGAARDAVATVEVALDTVDTSTQLPPPAPDPVATARSHRDHAWPTHTHPYPVAPDHDDVPHDPSIVHPRAAPLAAPAPPPPSESTPVETVADEALAFSITVGAGPIARGAAAVASEASVSATAATLPETQVDGRARLAEGAPPVYPEAARAAGVEGDVGLELVVGATGAVEEARVVRSAGHGLDDAAIRAARGFRFAPAVKDGHAVRVRMGWTVQFRLR